MLRLIENPTMNYLLGEGEYVMLKIKGVNAILVRFVDKNYVFTLMEEAILTGTTPSLSNQELVKDALGWTSIYGCVHNEHELLSIAEEIEWFVNDCHNYSSLSMSDIQVVSSGDMMTSCRVERTEFILKDYTDTIYTGLHGYHHSHSVTMNTPKKEMKEGAYRIGVELEIEAHSSADRAKINKVGSNWFFQETDSSLRDGRGIEIVTIPLLPKDAMSVDTWSPLVDFLKPLAESYTSSNCGLHVHIGREALGKDEDDRQATLGKLLFFYYEHLKPTSWNSKVFGRRTTYNEQEFKCKEAEAVKVLGMDLMAEKKIRDKVDKGLKDTASWTRYYDINVQNRATIEFRKGKGSICTERIVAIIAYCDLMIRYCRKRDWMNLNAEDFLAYIRKNAPKSSPLFRYLPTSGEEE